MRPLTIEEIQAEGSEELGRFYAADGTFTTHTPAEVLELRLGAARRAACADRLIRALYESTMQCKAHIVSAKLAEDVMQARDQFLAEGGDASLFVQAP